MTDTIRIHDRARKRVVDHLGVEEEKVTRDASFVDDLGADSLDVVELAMAVEEEFGVELHDDDAEAVFHRGNFGDLADWLDKQRTIA